MVPFLLLKSAPLSGGALRESNPDFSVDRSGVPVAGPDYVLGTGPAGSGIAMPETSFFGRCFSHRGFVAAVSVLAAALIVTGLLATQDLIPGLIGRIVEVAIVLSLGTLLIFCELARRDVVAARAGLVRSEEVLSYTQTASKIGNWEVDAAGNETWSSSFRDLLGVDATTPASTQAFHELVHPDDRDDVARFDAKMLNEPGEHEFEYRIRRADGEERCLLARGICIADARGVRERVLGVAIDLTRRKADDERNRGLEQQLIRAQRLETVGRLAGGIAHDFNNLLTGINGYADLAQAALDEGRLPREELDEIRIGGARAVALTRQLLAFSRQQVLKSEALDLNDVLRKTEKLLERLIGEDVRIEYACKRDCVTVSADRTQLEQVIVNLVVNAREAMPAGGQLTIGVDEAEIDAAHTVDLEPGRYALLTVTDTGEGMDAETSAQIFEPFFTTKPEGNGLGLATVHGIVAQSGGAIRVESLPGAGATFEVYLPLAAQPAEPAAGPVLPTPPSSGGERVLVVEDDRQVRAIVTNMLATRGYEVTPTSSGAEAITASEGAGLFDLILSDLVMPDMGGRELVEKVKELQPAAAILFMSGYSGDAVRGGGVVAPGIALLEKPFTAEELARHVRDRPGRLG